MYSITLAPAQDTPAVLNRYAWSFGVSPGWSFLTGNPADIELLRRKLGFAWSNPTRDAARENHTGNLRYGNEKMQWWAACPALSNPEWIAESISWVDWPREQVRS
jgi:protein SCO1/2